jgi:hypothetical protein
MTHATGFARVMPLWQANEGAQEPPLTFERETALVRPSYQRRALLWANDQRIALGIITVAAEENALHACTPCRAIPSRSSARGAARGWALLAADGVNHPRQPAYVLGLDPPGHAGIAVAYRVFLVRAGGATLRDGNNASLPPPLRSAPLRSALRYGARMSTVVGPRSKRKWLVSVAQVRNAPTSASHIDNDLPKRAMS